MYLLDTNIWIEVLLEQERSADAKKLIGQLPPEKLGMSDFSLYSIGLILARHNRDDVFARFLRDTLVEAGVRLHRLPVESLSSLVELGRKQGLDFDDAYQYAVCRAYELELVSFDDDFDSTPEGRLDPVDVRL